MENLLESVELCASRAKTVEASAVRRVRDPPKVAFSQRNCRQYGDYRLLFGEGCRNYDQLY